MESLNAKKVLALGGSIIAICVAGYLLFNNATPEQPRDESVAAVAESFTCSRCKHKFELTVAAAAAMMRDKGDVVCPNCGETGGAAKDNPKVVIGGFGAKPSPIANPSDDESTDDTEDKPKAPTVDGAMTLDPKAGGS